MRFFEGVVGLDGAFAAGGAAGGARVCGGAGVWRGGTEEEWAVLDRVGEDLGGGGGVVGLGKEGKGWVRGLCGHDGLWR